VAGARFARAVNNSRSRGIVFNRRDADIHKLINPTDRRALAALSRQCVFNNGVAKECIRQKASWSTLDAFAPMYSGEDTEAGEAAIDFLENEYFAGLDLTGETTDWPEFLQIISKAIDRDGESFILKTRDETERLALLILPSYMVRSEMFTVDRGEMEGARVEDGIGYDPQTGAKLFYRVWSSENDWEDIPAASMVHLFERDFPEQRRGFPAFSHALSDLLQSGESKDLEILRQLVVSNIFLLNKGGTPPSPEDAGYEALTNTSTDETILREQIAPGIQYLKTGQELDTITHNTPGDIWQNFRQSLAREAVVGAGWSYSLVSIGGANNQGTVERAEILRARLAVRARVKTLSRGARSFVEYGLSSPAAPPVANVFRGWSFSKPARLTVDDGREDRALLERVKTGAMSETAYQATHGVTLREHYVARAKELTLAATIAAEFSQPGTEISAADLMIRANAPPPAPDEITLEKGEPEETDETTADGNDPAGRAASSASTKEIINAYAIAVRAGALTPQIKDENYFRDLAGLPRLSEQGERLWRTQGGTRSPITLAGNKGETTQDTTLDTTLDDD
jgi:hypothetical protein